MSERKRTSKRLLKIAAASVAISAGVGALGYAYYKNKKPNTSQAMNTIQTNEMKKATSANKKTSSVNKKDTSVNKKDASLNKKTTSVNKNESKQSELKEAINKVDKILSTRKPGSLTKSKNVDDLKELAVNTIMNNKMPPLTQESLTKLSDTSVK